MPDAVHERPRWMKRQARSLQQKAVALLGGADASTLGERERKEVAELNDEAFWLLAQRYMMLRDPERAQNHPPNKYYTAAWGAEPEEPLPAFARAMHKTLRLLGVPLDDADELVDTGEGEGDDVDE